MCALFQTEHRPEKLDSRTDEQAFIHGIIFDFQQYRDLLPETIRGGKLIEQEEKLLDSIQADLTRAAKFKVVEIAEFTRLMNRRRSELGATLVRAVFKPILQELTDKVLPRFVAEYTTFKEEKENKSKKREPQQEVAVSKEIQKERILLIKKLQEVLTDEQSRNTKRLNERGRVIFQTIITYTKNLTANDVQTLERLREFIDQVDQNPADKKALAHIGNLVDRYQVLFRQLPDQVQRHSRVDEELNKFLTPPSSDELPPEVTVKKVENSLHKDRHARVATAFDDLQEKEKPYVQANHPQYLEQLLNTKTILRPGSVAADTQELESESTPPRVVLAPPPETLPVEPLSQEAILPLTDEDVDPEFFSSVDDVSVVPSIPPQVKKEPRSPSDSDEERLMSEESLERMIGAVDQEIGHPRTPKKPLSQMTETEQLAYAAQQEASGFDDIMSGLESTEEVQEDTKVSTAEKPRPLNRPTIPFSLETFPIRPRSITLPNGSTAEYVGNFDSQNQYEGRGIFKITGTPYDRLVIAYFDHGKLRHPDSVSIQFEIQTEKGKTRVTSTGPTDDNYLTNGAHCFANLLSPADHSEFEGSMIHGIPQFGTITYLSTNEDPLHIYRGPVSPDFSPIPNQGTWKVPGAETFKPEHTLLLSPEEVDSLRPTDSETLDSPESGHEMKAELSPLQQKLSDLVHNTRKILLAKIEAESENAQRIQNYELPILNAFEEIIVDTNIPSDAARFQEIDTYRDTIEEYLTDNFEYAFADFSEIFDLLGDLDTLIGEERQRKLESNSTDEIKPVTAEKPPEPNQTDTIEAIEILKQQIEVKLPGFTDRMFAFVGELLLSYPTEVPAEQEFLDIESILLFINSIQSKEDFTAQGIAQVCQNMADYFKNSQADQLACTEFVSQVHKLLTQYLEPLSPEIIPQEINEPLPPLIPHPFEQEGRTIAHGVPLPVAETIDDAEFEGAIPKEVSTTPQPQQRNERTITPPHSEEPVIEDPDMVDTTDDTYTSDPIHLRAEQGISVKTEPKPEKPVQTEGPSIIIEDSGMLRGLQEGVLRAQQVANIEKERALNREVQKTLESKVSTIFATANKQRGSKLPSVNIPSDEFFSRFGTNFRPDLRNLFAVTSNLRGQYEQRLAAQNITVADIHSAFETAPPLFALLPSTRAKEKQRTKILSNAQAQEWYALEIVLHHIKELAKE